MKVYNGQMEIAKVYLPEEELVQKALEALMTKLGPIETNRFLALTRQARVESVTRHRQWQETLDQETFFDTVFS